MYSALVIPAETISYVDDATKAKLPEGTQARTAKVTTLDAEGNEVSYFIKFHAMSALWNVIPEIVASAYGYGTYEKMEDVHFFLCSFHELTDDIPDIDEFLALVVEMHRRQISPDWKFGFPYEVYGGRLPQFFPVIDCWEKTVTSGLQRTLDSEGNSQGYDENMALLRTAVIEKVIPRLIHPLETGPNKIKPRIVHGDMWNGNCSVDVNTNRPYTKHCPISEPAEDFEDRVLLYSLRFNLHTSSLYPGNT
ncbi:Fructosamine kinase-domain-containing protein [Xylaria sp. FL0064]|nr:Fructosamine kinase-domain-containing protein [Xylaria sp. FL0064]